MIKCPNCWAENKPNAKFCKNCGAPLGDESNAPATTTATTIMGTSTQTQGRSKKKAVWGISAAVVALASTSWAGPTTARTSSWLKSARP
ncbi:MAG: zinc ribbon domain-containing protein [Lactobacillus sp.]|jgi:uncharacterized membrane protein YvbJ